MGVGGVSFTPALPDTLPVPSSCTCRGSHFSGKHLEARPPAPPGWAVGWGPHYLFSSQRAWDADSLRWRHPVCRKINRQLKLGCKSEKTAGLRAADKAGSLLLQQFRAAAARDIASLPFLTITPCRLYGRLAAPLQSLGSLLSSKDP